MPLRPSHALLASTLALAAACGEVAGPDGPEGALTIEVAPLSLPGIVDAHYTLTVHDGPGGTGDVVWTRALTSAGYGDGAGSLSYVGTCDAATGVNTVTLTLTALYDAGGLVPAGDYMNPTPIQREATCVADGDVPVDFDITLARRASQGFFDVAVQLEDVFCSAKLDCEAPGGGDLELLHDADGARATTVVLGFACTGSPSGDTFLYMDDLVIDCAGLATDVRVDPTSAGNIDVAAAPNANPGGYLFAASVFRGVEGLASKAYWNVSLGLDRDAFAAAGACTLTARATASSTPFPQGPSGFPLPAGGVYPVIDWSVQLSSATTRVCTHHAVDEAGSGVATTYLGYLPAPNQFSWSAEPIYLRHRYQPETGAVLSAGAPVCNPACVHGSCVAADTCACDAGWTGAACDAYAQASCLAWRDAGETTSGRYTVDADGEAGPVAPQDVFCEMDADGGGYGFQKVLAGAPQSAAEAEATCAARGMRLLIPRTPAHLAAAWAVANDPGFGPDASAGYLTILGIYPATPGATCTNRALAAGSPGCGWVAGDGGVFWVSELTTVAEPSGDSDVASSMAYTFDAGGAATGWSDSAAPGATSTRFMCGDVDKVFPQPASCLDWRDLGFVTSRDYVIDPDGGGDVQVTCDMDHGGGGWTKLNAGLVTLQVSKGTASWYQGSTVRGTGYGVDCGSPNARQYTLANPRLAYHDVYVLLHRTTSVLQCSTIGQTASGYYTPPYSGAYTSSSLCTWTLPWANACPPCDAQDMTNTRKDWVMYKSGTNPPLYYNTTCAFDDGGVFDMQWFVR